MLKYKIPQIVTLTRIKEWGKENKKILECSEFKDLYN